MMKQSTHSAAHANYSISFAQFLSVNMFEQLFHSLQFLTIKCLSFHFYHQFALALGNEALDIPRTCPLRRSSKNSSIVFSSLFFISTDFLQGISAVDETEEEGGEPTTTTPKPKTWTSQPLSKTKPRPGGLFYWG